MQHITDVVDDGVYIERFLEHLAQSGKSDRTIRGYRYTLQRVATWLMIQERDLLTATPDDLDRWRAELTVSPNSVAAYAVAVKSFFTWCRRKGVRDDPSLDLAVPPMRRGLPRPIGEDDLELAISTAPLRIRPWLVLAGYAGLRACEIATLRRDHIMNTADPMMIMMTGKGGNGRAVPMSPYVWTELLAAELPRRGPAFLRRDGKPGPNSAGLVSKLTNEHLHEIGLDDTFHSLRHRFGTRALKGANGNMRVVQELMGHASISTTQIYTAWFHPDAVAAVLAIQPQHPIPRG